MELRRLRLTNFRGVRDVAVDFRAPGVTVVLADNEAGKSSLLEALEKLFRLPDDSRHRELRSVQPVGRDVGTTVEAELMLGGHEVRYRKTWFRDRGTELHIDGRGHSGREAHDRAAELFARHVDAQLWETLVVGQAGSLVQPVPREVTALLAVLGRQADEPETAEAPDEGGSLAAAVEREYRRYFTPRDARPTGELAQAIADRDAAAVELTDARDRLDRVQQVVAEAERLQAERRLVTEQQAQQQRLVAQLSERVDAARIAESGLAESVTAAKLARVHADAAQAAAVGRDKLVAEHTDAAASAEAAAQALAAAQVDADRTESEAEAAKARIAETALQLREGRERLSRCMRARRHRQDVETLERVRARIDAVTQARADEAAARAVMARIQITADDVERVDKLEHDLALARATAAAAAPSLLVRRLGQPPVQVEGATTTSIESGGELDIAVTDQTTVSVPGVLDLTVRPGADAAGARASVTQVEADLADALELLGVADSARLRALAREREAAAVAAGEAARLAQVHLGSDAFDDLVRAREEVTARLHTVADPVTNEESALEPGTDDAATAEDALDEDALETRVRELEAAYEAARTAGERAQEVLGRVRSALVEARVLAEAAHERAARQLELLTTGRSERSDEQLREFADSAHNSAVAAEAAAERSRREFVEAGLDTAAAEQREAVEIAEQLTAQLAEIDAGRHAAQARLDDAGAAGLATLVDTAEAKAAQCEERHRLVTERADAAAVLRQTLTEHREAARRAYAEPLKELIEQLGRVAFGPSFGVTLDDLQVVERHLDGVILPVDSLSTGAREQLAIVVRLAISRLTAMADGGVPLILDDALGWADPARLAQMHRLLGEAGRTGQVVLLTSQRARFNLVPGAGEPVRLHSLG